MREAARKIAIEASKLWKEADLQAEDPEDYRQFYRIIRKWYLEDP